MCINKLRLVTSNHCVHTYEATYTRDYFDRCTSSYINLNIGTSQLSCFGWFKSNRPCDANWSERHFDSNTNVPTDAIHLHKCLHCALKNRTELFQIGFPRHPSARALFWNRHTVEWFKLEELIVYFVSRLCWHSNVRTHRSHAHTPMHSSRNRRIDFWEFRKHHSL